MQIEDYIIQLLDRHECVLIPGFGGFVKSTTKSLYNADIHRFSPPRVRISFNAKLKDNDGLLLHYMAQKEGKSYTQVQEELKKYVHFLNTSMLAHETVLLPKIGLFFTQQGRLQFQGFELDRTQAINASFFGLPEITVQKREEIPSAFDVHKTRSSTSFWRYAASLLLLLNLGLLISLNTPLRYKIEEASLALFSDDKPEKYIPRTADSKVSDLILIPDSVHEEVSISPPIPATTQPETASLSHPYKIIVGCFKEEENARNFSLSESLKPYPSFYFYHNGLYKVCVYSTLSDIQAHEQLAHFQHNTSLQAWILKQDL